MKKSSYKNKLKKTCYNGTILHANWNEFLYAAEIWVQERKKFSVLKCDAGDECVACHYKLIYPKWTKTKNKTFFDISAAHSTICLDM